MKKICKMNIINCQCDTKSLKQQLRVGINEV